MMMLVIEKLDKQNFHLYQKKIIYSLQEEYEKTYNKAIDDKQLHKLSEYCISYMYVLVLRSYRSKVIGYFSLSRTDLNKTYSFPQFITSYVLGNVYLFDVYVYPKYRNKGVGKYLVGKAVHAAVQNFNASNIYLYTNSIQLLKFYNRNKFIYIRNVTIDNNELLLFVRTIDSNEAKLFK